MKHHFSPNTHRTLLSLSLLQNVRYKSSVFCCTLSEVPAWDRWFVWYMNWREGLPLVHPFVTEGSDGWLHWLVLLIPPIIRRGRSNPPSKQLMVTCRPISRLRQLTAKLKCRKGLSFWCQMPRQQDWWPCTLTLVSIFQNPEWGGGDQLALQNRNNSQLQSSSSIPEQLQEAYPCRSLPSSGIPAGWLVGLEVTPAIPLLPP